MVNTKCDYKMLQMAINTTLNDLNEKYREGLIEKMGIVYSYLSENELWGTLPVKSNTQPFGLLHGGAHCVLGETLGSLLALLKIDSSKKIPVGQNIFATHLKAQKTGLVTGKCKIVHFGKNNHIFETKNYNEMNELLSIIQLNVAIISK